MWSVMTETYDAIVIGGGMVGAATAFNLKSLGCERVLLIEREQTCSGGTVFFDSKLRTENERALRGKMRTRLTSVLQG